jgi:TRAP-type transport system small permease protein
MKKINEIIKRLEYSIGTVMLIAIVMLVFISAILRVFNHPLVWSVDASQLLFIWISMIGADLAFKNKAHMGVDLLVMFFPAGLQKSLKVLSYILCFAFAIFITYWGITLCFQNYLRKYQTLRISYSFATAAVPTLAICVLLTIIEQMGDLFRTWNNKEVK